MCLDRAVSTEDKLPVRLFRASPTVFASAGRLGVDSDVSVFDRKTAVKPLSTALIKRLISSFAASVFVI